MLENAVDIYNLFSGTTHTHVDDTASHYLLGTMGGPKKGLGV